MATLIASEGCKEGTDVDALSYSPFVPVRLPGHYVEVTHAKVVLGISCMLHDRGFE